MQHLRNLIELAPSAMAMFTGKEHLLSFANSKFREIFELDNSDHSNHGNIKKITSLVPDLHSSIDKVSLSNSLQEILNFELNLPGYKDRKYYDISFYPVTGDDAEVSAVMMSLNDVTAHISSLNSAKENERQLQRISDAVPVLIAYVDKDRCYRFNNKAYETWFGHNRTAIYGRHMREVLGEAAYKNVESYIDQVLSGKKVQFESLLKYKDGGERYVLGTYVPNFDEKNEVVGFYVEVDDITNQQKTMEALKESELRFKLMADSSPVMIWTLDADGNSTYYNRKATEFTGHTEDELNSGRTWQTAIHPDDIENASSIVGKAVQEKIPYQMECRMKRADGEWRWLVNHGMPKLNEYNELIGYVGSSYDITERKIAEDSLKDSDDRYQNFIKQSTEGIWRIELEVPVSIHASNEEQFEHFFRYAYLAECNDAMARMYGYSQSKELLNARLSDFYDRNDESTGAYFNLFIDSDYRLENTESKELDRNGEVKYFSNNLVGVIENDMLVRAWGTQNDITAQKQAEEKLAESEKYFRQLTDTVPVIIWITRPDGYCTYLNNNWYDYTGQTPGEAEGFGWLNATHPDDASEAGDKFMEASRDHKPYNVLYRLRNKSGEYRWAVDRGQPKFSLEGEFEGMIGTVTDVHEQKLAEDRLKENEQKFRKLAETLPQLVWMTDAEGNAEYASSRWIEYSGIEPVSASAWEQMVHESDLANISNEWSTSLVTGKLYKTEVRLRNKNGDYRWHFVQGEPIRDEHGKIMNWIGAFTDIHDQKTITEKLELLVNERTRELQRSNEDLQQFAHVASHDLKEPVRKIKLYAGRLQDEDSNSISPAGNTYLSKMQSAADRMYTMIDGVLMYSTLNAVSQKIEEVDLDRIISDIENDLELLIQQKRAELRRDDLPVVEGAAVLLYQLFYNLVNNSLKFSKDGVPPLITIQSSTSKKDGEDFIEIILQDNGIGFDPSYKDRIFTTFARLHAKDKYDGTGLGLSLCKKIAERHAGSIQAEGKLNEGARFIIQLPEKQKQSYI